MAMEQAREAAQAVSEFFQGNPFGTQIGKMIEQATEGTLPSENWALNMEICDAINTMADGPRDAVRAIRKRLQMAMGKNNTTVLYTLTVLETCVKNCDARFHHLITQKEFIQELVKLIGPKFDPPQVVQEKVLTLIQSWADAFRGHPEYKGVCEIYDDLKSKGVEFPMTDLDTLAPIITPQRSVPEPIAQPQPQPQATMMRQQPSSPRTQAQQQQQAVRPVAAGPINPTPDQLAKLRSELDVVNGNVKVLREMLAELHPGKEDPEDFQLLQQLYQTCKAMQQRVVELLQRVANEEVTSELLLINDEMNNVFAKYDRYISNRAQPESAKTPSSGAATAASMAPGKSSKSQEPETSLIDFGSDTVNNQHSDLSSQLAGMSVGATSRVSDIPQVPMSQSHANTSGSKHATSTYEDNTKIDQLNVGLGTVAQQRGQMFDDKTPSMLEKEREIAEMEAWLKANPGAKVPNADETSEEFDQFLAQRAKAAENLPKAQGDKKNDDDKMFAL